MLIGDRVIITNPDLQKDDQIGYTYPIKDFNGKVILEEFIPNGHHTDVVYTIESDEGKIIGRFFEKSLESDKAFYRNEKINLVL